MSLQYEKFKDKAFSVFKELGAECPEFVDAQMLVGSSEATASLVKCDTYKSIDTEWIDVIENAMPYLDVIVRTPSIAIKDVDEILPVELSRHITEKSVKHLAQHTNLILDVKGDEVIPQKILNVYHDETYLTYENKFVNTLLLRLSAFIDKRYKALAQSRGKEQSYRFQYSTGFEHQNDDSSGRNTAKINLSIELTSPIETKEQGADGEVDASYTAAVERIVRINSALMSYRSSVFAQKLGRNYIRPPVIRTNAILKNKNFKECLTLWEFIEGYDKAGYTVRTDAQTEIPAEGFISDLYSSVAFQYVDFYNGVTKSENNRLISDKHIFEIEPEFKADVAQEDVEEYQVYDSEYKKSVPVSRLLNNRRNLSDDEKRIAEALSVALKADGLIALENERNEKLKKKEEEQRRIAEEKRKIAEERERIAEEKRQAVIERKRVAEEKRLEKERLRLEEEQRIAEEIARKKEEQRARAIERARRRSEKYRPKPQVKKNTYKSKNTVKEARIKALEKPEFTFKGESALKGVPYIEFTREEYFAMPRKKKKKVAAEAVRRAGTEL